MSNDHSGVGRHGDHIPQGLTTDPVSLIGQFTNPNEDPRLGTAAWKAAGPPIAECFNCGTVMDEEQHSKGECPHCGHNLFPDELGEDE